MRLELRRRPAFRFGGCRQGVFSELSALDDRQEVSSGRAVGNRVAIDEDQVGDGSLPHHAKLPWVTGDSGAAYKGDSPPVRRDRTAPDEADGVPQQYRARAQRQCSAGSPHSPPSTRTTSADLRDRGLWTSWTSQIHLPITYVGINRASRTAQWSLPIGRCAKWSLPIER